MIFLINKFHEMKICKMRVYVLFIFLGFSCVPLPLYVAKSPHREEHFSNELRGSLFFSGYQIYRGNWVDFKFSEDQENEILTTLLKEIPTEFIKKINVTRVDPKVFSKDETKPFAKTVSYTFHPFKGFIPVYDDSIPWHESQKMYSICLNHLNSRNKADYFLSFTEGISRYKDTDIELVLDVSIYSMNGDKVYYKGYIYSSNSKFTREKDLLFEVTLKMIKDKTKIIIEDIKQHIEIIPSDGEKLDSHLG
jgi:hypothetical protein